MIDEAVTSARSAFPNWSQTTVRHRAAIARRYGDLVLANRDRILDAIQADTKKSRTNALDEILDVVGLCAYYARKSPSILKSRRRAGAVPVLRTLYEVRG